MKKSCFSVFFTASILTEKLLQSQNIKKCLTYYEETLFSRNTSTKIKNKTFFLISQSKEGLNPANSSITINLTTRLSKYQYYKSSTSVHVPDSHLWKNWLIINTSNLFPGEHCNETMCIAQCIPKEGTMTSQAGALNQLTIYIQITPLSFLFVSPYDVGDR